jgi:hypothetical protein
LAFSEAVSLWHDDAVLQEESIPSLQPTRREQLTLSADLAVSRCEVLVDKRQSSGTPNSE